MPKTVIGFTHLPSILNRRQHHLRAYLKEEELEFYRHCPTMSQQSKELMEAETTEAELLKALYSCKDSAPGSDGISYSVYKRMWDIVGSFFVNAWNYSC